MKRNRRILTLCVAPLLILTLTACSSASGAERGFQIAFCAPVMNADAIEAWGEGLMEEIPELRSEDSPALFTSVIMGEMETEEEEEEEMGSEPTLDMGTDPMMTIAGMTRFTGMIASSELDVVISDLSNAAGNARSGAFMPLEELFTEEELSLIGARQLSFDMVEYDYETEQNIPTGETTEAVGFAIEGNESLEAIFGSQELGVFVAYGTKDTELAKKVVLEILG